MGTKGYTEYKIHVYTYTYMCIYLYIYIYIYMLGLVQALAKDQPMGIHSLKYIS